MKSADLSLLDKLPRAKDARWDYVDRSACLEGTRIEELDKIGSWMNNETERRMYLLSGLAGTGKTTIAKSVAGLADDDGVLGASFFCSRDSDDRSKIEFIFSTITFQLSKLNRRFCAEVITVLKEEPDIGHSLPDRQLKELIAGPLQKMGSFPRPVVIVLDALDECKDEKAPEKILLALSRHIHSIPFLKIFVTTRPVSSARFALRDSLLDRLSQVFILHDVDRSRVDGDIRLFINFRLAEIAKRRSGDSLPPIWPSEHLLDKLVQKSSGLFIFAFTICKFVESPGDLQEQLEDIAELRTTAHEGRLGIDGLYEKVIKTAMASFANEKMISLCRFVVGTIVLLFNPLSAIDLAQVLDIKPGLVRGVLTDLHSVIVVPPKDDKIIHAFHASFHDFLTSEHRSSDQIYVHPARQHAAITLGLFKRMMQGLRRNICRIDDFKENKEVEDLAQRRERYIGNSLAYACRYWAEHLSHVSPMKSAEELIHALNEFIRNKLLYWIEVLSLLGDMAIAVTALDKVRKWHLVSSGVIPHYVDIEIVAYSRCYNRNFPFLSSFLMPTDLYLNFSNQLVSVLSIFTTQLSLSHLTAPCYPKPSSMNSNHR